MAAGRGERCLSIAPDKLSIHRGELVTKVIDENL